MYPRNLSLNEIAEQVYLTSTYICLIFKQETGETINEYLTKTRLEKAKELLKDPLQKLNHIGQSVGYPDPSYFTRLFKKHTGLTPTEYRERIL
jgi:two-component system response regulator YesN